MCIWFINIKQFINLWYFQTWQLSDLGSREPIDRVCTDLESQLPPIQHLLPEWISLKLQVFLGPIATHHSNTATHTYTTSPFVQFPKLSSDPKMKILGVVFALSVQARCPHVIPPIVSKHKPQILMAPTLFLSPNQICQRTKGINIQIHKEAGNLFSSSR